MAKTKTQENVLGIRSGQDAANLNDLTTGSVFAALRILRQGGERAYHDAVRVTSAAVDVTGRWENLIVISVKMTADHDGRSADLEARWFLNANGAFELFELVQKVEA